MYFETKASKRRQESKKRTALRRLVRKCPTLLNDLRSMSDDVSLLRDELYPAYKEPGEGAARGFFIKFFETISAAERLVEWTIRVSVEADQQTKGANDS